MFIKLIHLSSFKGFIDIQITINFIMNKQPVAKLITCDGYYFLLITEVKILIQMSWTEMKYEDALCISRVLNIMYYENLQFSS